MAEGPNPIGAYDRLFRHEGRIVSLTILPTGASRDADAALMLLLGQRTYNGDDLISGMQIMEGLRRSGITIDRADRVWGPHMDTNVIRVGQNRGVKYRLTNPGNTRAGEMARELLAMLP